MTPQIDLSFLRSPAARKRIGAITAVCAVVGALYGLLAPPWYRSVLTVVPAKAQRGGGALSSLLGGDTAGIASGLLEGSGGGADASRIAAVLQSTAVTDAVIEKLDLRARYQEGHQENARDELWRHCDIKVLTKPQLVQLSCEDKDPRFVQELLEYFADYGNQVFRRVGVSSATEEVRFLEKRVAELRKQAEQTATRMRDFQEQHKIVDIDTQAKAVVSALAALNTQRITKQLELEYQRTYSSREESSLRQLESQLSVMNEKVRSLEEVPLAPPAVANEQGRRPGAGRMFPAALEVPKLRAEFEGLYRDRKVAETTLIFALERLESAKANEARDVSTFQVLDPPTLPTKKSRPKRVLSVLVAGLVGLLVALSIEMWKSNDVNALIAAALAPRSGKPESSATQD